MSEYLHIEKPFLDQLSTLGWTVIDQGQGFIPCDPTVSLRDSFREWLLPGVFRDAVRGGSGVVLDIWRFVTGCAKFMRHLCKVLIPNGTGPRSRACHLVI
jgi:hypothetical protein